MVPKTAEHDYCSGAEMIVLVLALIFAALLLLRRPQARGLISLREDHKNSSKPAEEPVELILDLSASLMDSGLPITELLDTLGQSIEHCAALRTVARCLEMNMEWEKAWHSVPQWLTPLQRCLGFAHATGAPAANLLRNAAVLHRREREQRVAKLGAQFATRLVLPLGVCALPAFIVLGVVPLIVALFPHMS